MEPSLRLKVKEKQTKARLCRTTINLSLLSLLSNSLVYLLLLILSNCKLISNFFLDNQFTPSLPLGIFA